MKTKLLAAAVLAGTMLATPALAADFRCGMPTVFLGDDAGNNPVISVDVNYEPEQHAWQIFHHMANGQVAARAQQYAITDWTKGDWVRWSGSLNRSRSLYMIGTLSEAGDYYEERLYDRALGGRLVMQMGVKCHEVGPAPVVAAAPSEMLFTIPTNVGDGHMNVRTGPGTNHGLIGAIPGGQTVTASRCVPRDDGLAGADWCFVSWNGLRGWVSRVGLMPVAPPMVETRVVPVPMPVAPVAVTPVPVAPVAPPAPAPQPVQQQAAPVVVTVPVIIPPYSQAQAPAPVTTPAPVQTPVQTPAPTPTAAPAPIAGKV